MSLMQKIKVVIDMFSDTAMRLDVAQTLSFLFDVYANNKANEEQIRNDLHDLFLTIVRTARPDLSPDEKKKVVEDLVEDFINTFKLESSMRRMMIKYRTPISIWINITSIL